MIAGVADKHAVLWYLLKDTRLSTRARDFMDEAAAGGNDIAVSTISLAEIVYLIEKKRFPAAVYHNLKAALASSDYAVEKAPLTVEIVDAMRRIPRADVPDLPDRVVAATGLFFGVPVISRDGRIRASDVETIW